MNAGRELDALVAEKVMGWKKTTDGHIWVALPSCEYIRDVGLFCPSELIADAWMVVEKRKTYTLTIEWMIKGTWWACFIDDVDDGTTWYSAEAPTAPEAICLAALKAVGE